LLKPQAWTNDVERGFVEGFAADREVVLAGAVFWAIPWAVTDSRYDRPECPVPEEPTLSFPGRRCAAATA
jgi:hypothetical protein